MSYPACPKCGCNDHNLDIYKCHACNKFFCMHCGGETGLLSLTPNCYVCGSNYRVNRYAKVENPLVAQQRYYEEHERKRIVSEENSRQSSGSGGRGGSTSSVGGAIYLGLGSLFLLWLYFTNKSNIPSASLQSTTSASPISDNKPNSAIISIDQMKSDLLGMDVGGIPIQNLDELKSFSVIDSVKSINNNVQYTLSIELQRGSKSFNRFIADVYLEYNLYNNKFTFLSARCFSLRKKAIKQNFSGIIGKRPIEIHLVTNPNASNLGQFVYVDQPDFSRQIAKNSDFSGDIINLDVIADSFSMFKAVLYYDESTQKYSGLVTYHDDATDSMTLWVMHE